MIGRQLTLLFILILCFVPPVFGGGPWTQPAGEGFAQLSLSGIISYNELYSKGSGDIRLNRDVSDITLQGYIEYGLTDRFTLIGYIPYKIVTTGDDINGNGDFPTVLNSGDLTGFGNLAFAFKGKLVDRSMQVSGQIRVDANTVKREPTEGLRTGYSAWSFTPSLIVGGSRKQFYGFVETGVRLRTNDYSDDVIVNAEIGYRPFAKLWLAGVLDILQTLSDGTQPADGSEQTGLYADNQEYIAYGIKLLGEITPNWGVNLSGFSAASGNLVAKSAAFTLGLYYKW